MEVSQSTDTIDSCSADEAAHQRIETARIDPTQPLSLGIDAETDDPVTLSRTEPFAPVLITSTTGTGKTTLSHHLATQQLTPDSGLCYVSGVGHAFDSPHPNGRETTSIDPGPYRDVTDAIDAVPDDIGTTDTITNVCLNLGSETDAETQVMSALIEQVLINRYRDHGPTVSPYTLVCDGTTALSTVDPHHLRRLLAQARKLRLHVIIAVQTLRPLSLPIRQWLANNVRTYITGQVAYADAQQLAQSYPTVTATDLTTLPRYHWWLCEDTAEGFTETQFTSLTPQLPQHG